MAAMKYYLVKNMRVIAKTLDNDGNIIGIGTKMPVSLKPYAYYKICFKPPDQSECVIQSEDDIKSNDATEITLEQAQKYADNWAKDCAPVEVTEDEKTVVKAKAPENVASYDHKDIKAEMQRLYVKYGEVKHG